MEESALISCVHHSFDTVIIVEIRRFRRFRRFRRCHSFVPFLFLAAIDMISSRIAICAAFTLIGLVQADIYSNPLKPTSGSDPFMVYVDGFYYLTTTTGGDVALTRAETLDGLKTGEYKSIFKDTVPERSCNYWAPGTLPWRRHVLHCWRMMTLEMHLIDGM